MEQEAGKAATPTGGAGFYDKLLVIGSDTAFSEALIDYSLDMAERMGYSIIAVNLHSIPKARRIAMDSADMKEEIEKLKKRSENAAKLFATKAVERGVGFQHEVRIGDLDDVARKISGEREDIDLILVEPEYVNEDPEGPRSIPAFCLAGNGG